MNGSGPPQQATYNLPSVPSIRHWLASEDIIPLRSAPGPTIIFVTLRVSTVAVPSTSRLLVTWRSTKVVFPSTFRSHPISVFPSRNVSPVT